MQPLNQSPTTRNLQLWKNICIYFMKAYQEQKVAQMIALCHRESTICFKPLGDEGKGKIDQLGHGLWTTLIDSFPDIDNTVHSIVYENKAIKCIVSIRGTPEKDFAGIKSKGGSFDSEHIFIFKLDENQKIKHLDIEWDHADFVRQLS
ncbi:MAG: ester cyclase [Saprospiraceae bacterium]|nr:ester cyclase [Saprospiraceae bacterium]